MSRQYPPAETGLDNATIDLQALAAYASPILDVTTQFRWTAYMTVASVGGSETTGLAKLTVTYYDDLAGTTVVAVEDIVTAINTKIHGQQEALSWGRDGTSHDGSGTLATGALAFAQGNFMKFTVTVTEVNNAATSADASVFLFGEESVPA